MRGGKIYIPDHLRETYPLLHWLTHNHSACRVIATLPSRASVLAAPVEPYEGDEAAGVPMDKVYIYWSANQRSGQVLEACDDKSAKDAAIVCDALDRISKGHNIAETVTRAVKTRHRVVWSQRQTYHLIVLCQRDDGSMVEHLCTTADLVAIADACAVPA